MTGVLEGIRVVDWGVWFVGPGGTALLADLGAEVIHVEQTGSGDPVRGLRTAFGVSQTLPDDRQVTFEYANRNKKAISLDISKPEGAEAMRRLLRNSDILVTNVREPSVKKLGFGYEDVKALNPRIIYVNSSTYGRRGPDAGAPGLDIVCAARSGLMMASGDLRTAGEPTLPPVSSVDEMGATMVAFAALAGLIARDRLGISQDIYVSMLGATLRTLGFVINQNLLLGADCLRQDRAEAKNPLYNYYKCRDDKWIVLGSLREQDWVPFCETVGLQHLLDDPKCATMELRSEHCRELVAVIDDLFLQRDREQWLDMLRGADLMFSPVNRIPDLPSDPQMLDNNFITTFDHPTLGKRKFVGFPVEFTKTPMTLRSPAPKFGQHNFEILTQVCGYTDDEVTRLYESGICG